MAYKLPNGKGYRIGISIGAYFIIVWYGMKGQYRTPDVYRKVGSVRVKMGSPGEYQVEVWRMTDKRTVFLDGGMAKAIKLAINDLDALLGYGDYVELPETSPVVQQLLSVLSKVRFD